MGTPGLAADVKLFPFCTVGMAPQDIKYKGEPTRCEIGARTQVRERCTIHRGTVTGRGLTQVGSDCLLMAVAHVAHNCRFGDHVIVANNAVMGGHVSIGDHAVIGGAAAIHQFVQIGRAAMIGGVSGVEADVIPFGSVIGNRAHLAGLNVIGLKRRGFDKAQIHTLHVAFRVLFRQAGVFAQRLAETRALYATDTAGRGDPGVYRRADPPGVDQSGVGRQRAVDRKPPAALTQSARGDQEAAWREFMAFVDRHAQSYWLFRGVANAVNHRLVPKIARDADHYDPQRERVVFANFQRRARQFIDTSGLTAWDLLALAQHHGLPTRLLDWTTNPLRGGVFCGIQQAGGSAARIYAVKASQPSIPSASEDPFAVSRFVVVLPGAIASQIVSQRGLFTVHPEPTKPWTTAAIETRRHMFDTSPR